MGRLISDFASLQYSFHVRVGLGSGCNMAHTFEKTVIPAFDSRRESEKGIVDLRHLEKITFVATDPCRLYIPSPKKHFHNLVIYFFFG